MSRNPPPADLQDILDDAWGHVVGGMDWLSSVLLGEFADNRPLSAVVADMLISFVPGVVIVTSARDAVAVILRLTNHPEKREDLMEWVLLSACLIVVALPLAMAAGGAAAMGAGAIVGGIAGSELGAALRAVMLMLIKEAAKLVELVRFLQKFMKGDILKFLRAVKFAKYEKALIEAMSKITGQLVAIVKALRTHLESLRYFDTVKTTIAKLTEWESKFYSVQQAALKQMPKALAEMDARLAKLLAETAPKEAHAVAAGVKTSQSAAKPPPRQRIKDSPGKILARIENKEPKPTSANLPKSPPEPPLKDSPAPVEPPPDKANTKRQAALDVETASIREKARMLTEKIGSDIKHHPLRQAYETEVAGLKEEAQMMVKAGVNDEAVARKLWERRRELGVKYKNMTPEPLRHYIYELNTGRYNDPLGPSFDSLVKSAEKKLLDPYQTIIGSSTRPNGDINGLLIKFEEWLSQKEPTYLDETLKNIGS